MKKTKSIFCICLIFVLLFSMTVPCFATQSDYDFLLNCGFSKEYLDFLTDEMLEKIRNSIGDNETVVLENKTIVFRENSGLDGVQTYGSISEKIFSIDIQATHICKKDTDIISSTLVSVAWEWAYSTPWIRKEDAVTVNWDSTIYDFSGGSFYAQDLCKGYNGTEWLPWIEYTSTAEGNQGGLGHYTTLAMLEDCVGGVMIFLLSARDTMTIGKDKGTSFTVNYVHDKNPLPVGLSFNLGEVGVSIDARGLTDSLSDTYNIRYST